MLWGPVHVGFAGRRKTLATALTRGMAVVKRVGSVPRHPGVESKGRGRAVQDAVEGSAY